MNKMAFPFKGADMPNVVLVMGAFSPAGAGAPTTVGGNASAALTNYPGTATNVGWGPAGFGRFIASVARSGAGVFLVTFTDGFGSFLGGAADLLSDDVAHTFWAQGSGQYDATNKQWTIRTLQSSGAVPGAAVVDVPNTSKPVISFWCAFSDTSVTT